MSNDNGATGTSGRGFGDLVRVFSISLVACLIVLGSLLFVYEDRRNEILYENQIASCERLNQVRSPIIANIVDSQRTVNAEIIKFVDSSVRFRTSQDQDKLAAESKAIRDKIMAANALLETPAKVDCNFVVQHP